MLVLVPSLGAPAAATTSTLTVKVVSARTEPRAFGGAGVLKDADVPHFKFLINEDDTGTTTQRTPNPLSGCAATDLQYPASCHWPSIQEPSGWAPIVTQGDESDLAAGLDLPDGRYLISVLADGYAIDGAHFTVPLPNPGLVTVGVQPDPLPDSTLKGNVFVDNAPTNMGPDTGEAPLKGFLAHVLDTLGEVQTDVYGNPLCTEYEGENLTTHEIALGSLDADMLPIVAKAGGKCLSDADGIVTVPHLGPNRYTLSVTPPNDGKTWIQTTTLEGNHDYDSWQLPGDTGFDNTFTVGGEITPLPIFGFVNPLKNGAPLDAAANGHVKGSVVGIKTYTPPKGGSFDFWGGNTGTKENGPIRKPWLSLVDLDAGDVAVWIGQGNTDGTFDISGVPDGNYSLSWWDEPQDYNLNMINLVVKDGGTVHLGSLPLNGWWTEYDGYVFNDSNRNGVKDPGEKGVPNFTLTLRRRENNLMDRGQNTATTDANGYYRFESGYPVGEWYILEAYDDRYYTTGVTYQADNQNTPTTVKGAGVDVSTIPIIGLSGRMDWGVHAYDPTGANHVDPRNGGIVGTISYDTTRNEVDPQYAASEDWQTGISNVPVELWTPVDCGTSIPEAPCDQSGRYELAPDGSLAHGKLLNTYVSESWERPTGCTARDVDGNALVHAADNATNYDENVLVPTQETDGECISSFMQGIQYSPYATDQGGPDANFGASVNGNYGFGDGCFDGTLGEDAQGNPTCDGPNGFEPLKGGVDYLVVVDIPKDATGKPMYKATAEEDINIGNGDQIVPQVPPPACAGALHTVDLADVGASATLDTGVVADNNALNWTAVEAGTPGNDNTVALVVSGTDTPLSIDVTGSAIVVNVATDAAAAATSTATQVAAAVTGDTAASALVTVASAAGSDGTGVVAPLAATHLTGGTGRDNYPAVVGDGGDVPVGVTVPASTPVDNATFLDIGGSPFEGSARPRCDTKLVELNNGKSIVPMFNMFTDVPVPSRLRAVIIDDLNFSADPKSVMYGEKAGLAFAPVGIYDFNNRLVYTAETDYNGIYDVLMPSTNHISCPTPSGVCAGMYRMVANDPGIPGSLNPNYNPRFRTHAAGAEAMPGMTTFADLAPTQVGLNIESPRTGQSQAVTCPVADATPNLLRVSDPYVNTTRRTFTITGTGFGATRGTGAVKLDGTALPASAITSWSSTSIDVSVPTSVTTGAKQLKVTANNGQSTTNGLTFHVLGTGYNPNLITVGPSGRSFTTIQAALDEARRVNNDDLVIVYPGSPTPDNPRLNPRGAYYENLIMTSPVKLQGVGPGGFQGSTYVSGSIIDASAFGGDTAAATAWFNKVAGYSWSGSQTIADGEGIYVLASETNSSVTGSARAFTAAYKASIDGFDLRGGQQNGFPGNVNDLTGGATGLPPTIESQGGAIFANAYVRNLQVTNNVVQNNGGGYGTIRIGTPDLTGADTNQHNEDIRIANNRIIANAGTNLAGAVGLFAGSDRYEVTANDICGNYSLEYGGGVGVYGFSPNGKIHHNRIYLNESNDEGGGIMIAGQLPAVPGTLSPGSGPVDIYNNQIQANLANDDGGGIRFLMAGNFPMNVYNNMIVNNVSTHEGGGVGINDAPNVRFYNNTVMKNLTTATAVTSNGQAAPAGLSTSANSDQLQVTLPGANPPVFSKPTMFNNIFWDNRAGTRAGTTVTGIGLPGDPPGSIDEWDVGVADETGLLTPTSSVLQQDSGQHAFTTDASNSSADPAVVGTFDLSVSFKTWRQNPSFVDATLVTLDAPPDAMGDYHLNACPGSPACNLGVASSNGINAPTTDYDDQARPALGGFDAGADEFGAPTPPPPPPAADLYFSTAGNATVPGVVGFGDNADVYRWSSTGFTGEWRATVHGVPASANVDGVSRIDATHFYLSFTGNVTLAGFGTVADEDVVYYDNGRWLLWFDGSAHGLPGGIDLGATSVVGSTLYFSTNNAVVPPGAGASNSGDNADVYRWNGGSSYTRVMDATAAPYNLPNSGSATGPNNPNVDGVIWRSPSDFYLTFSNPTTNVPGLGVVDDEDVIHFNGTSWEMYFDGTAYGLGTSANLELDAISFATGATAPAPTPPLYFSTLGNTNPQLVAGAADDADIYKWDGTIFTRHWDASAFGLPASANVDGYDRVDDTHFYMSFSVDTTVPGLGAVQDEDVVYYNAGVWSVFFDGTAHGMTPANLDLDAISIVGSTLYFSTLGNTNPPGVTGTADDADIYRYNGGNSYTRVWDASVNGLPGSANVDGYVRIDDTHFYLSFSNATTAVPGLGTVPDEDVVFYNGALRSLYFDGSAYGLMADSQDVDAFDVP